MVVSKALFEIRFFTTNQIRTPISPESAMLRTTTVGTTHEGTVLVGKGYDWQMPDIQRH
jgi:hypothetical protein